MIFAGSLLTFPETSTFERLVTSQAAQTALAENCAGLPIE
jgi:hypothetical protein